MYRPLFARITIFGECGTWNANKFRFGAGHGSHLSREAELSMSHRAVDRPRRLPMPRALTPLPRVQLFRRAARQTEKVRGTRLALLQRLFRCGVNARGIKHGAPMEKAAHDARSPAA